MTKKQFLKDLEELERLDEKHRIEKKRLLTRLYSKYAPIK